MTRRKGSPRRSPGESERMSSPRPQIAQQNRTAGEPASDRFLEAAPIKPMKIKQALAASKDLRMGRGGTVLRTAPRRGRDLAKRGEAQGGSLGTWRSACHPTCL